MVKRRFSIGFLVAIVAASCSGPAPHEHLVGEWKAGGSMNAAFKAKTPDWKEVMATIVSISYSIKEDGRFVMWLPKSRVGGIVKVEGDVVTFTPDSVNEVPLETARPLIMETVERQADPKSARDAVNNMLSPERMRLRPGGQFLDMIDPEDLKDGTWYLERVPAKG